MTEWKTASQIYKHEIVLKPHYSRFYQKILNFSDWINHKIHLKKLVNHKIHKKVC